MTYPFGLVNLYSSAENKIYLSKGKKKYGGYCIDCS